MPYSWSGARRKARNLLPWFEKEYRARIQEAIRARSLVDPGADEKPAWADLVLGVLELLQASVTRVEALTRTSQEEVGRSINRFQVALLEQARAVGKFEDATTAMHRGVDNLNAVYQAGKNTYRGLNSALPEIKRGIAVLATHQDRTATALQSIEAETERAANSVNAVAQQFTEAGLVQVAAQAAEIMKQAAGDMRSAARHMLVASEEQRQLQKQVELLHHELTTRSPAETPRSSGAQKKGFWPFGKKK